MNNHNLIQKIIFALSVVFFISCGSGGEGDPGDGGNTGGGDTLEKATLKYPANNEECSDGNTVSETIAEIGFDWDKATGAKAYTLFLTNLNTNTTTQHDSSTDRLTIEITRGVSYSWYVISKVEASSTSDDETEKSDTWNFYLAAPGTENFVPFPAKLNSPENNSVITGTTSVTLEWEGSDLDNDIKEYEIYLDDTVNPSTLVQTQSSTSLTQTVTAGKTYYWKVITKDNAGNNSSSSIYSFAVK